MRFSLRNNDGVMVAKAPWKIQLGGGASVESPHFQRVHYCELLLGDFVQRLQVPVKHTHTHLHFWGGRKYGSEGTLCS